MLDLVDAQYIKDRNLLPTNSRILDQSYAAAKLCKWCRATYRYLRANSELIGVRERLFVDNISRQKEVAVTDVLLAKRDGLAVVRDKAGVIFHDKLLVVARLREQLRFERSVLR